MKALLLSILAGLFALVGNATGNPLLLVDGSPNPPGLPYINIQNDTLAIYTRGTDFRDVAVGQTLRHKIRIRNLGGMQLNYTASDNSNQFRAIGTGSVLVASTGVREFEIEFAPTSPGVKNSVLTITSNDPNNSPFEINLTGTGVSPDLDILGGISFNQLITPNEAANTNDRTHFGTLDRFDSKKVHMFRLKNNGAGTLTYLTANISGDSEFTIANPPAQPSTVAPGEHLNFLISFNPGAVGTKNAQVVIGTNDPVNPSYVMNVRAMVTVAPEIGVQGGSPVLVDLVSRENIPLGIRGTLFEDTLVGQSSTNNFVMKNTGSSELNYTVSFDPPSPAFSVNGLNSPLVFGSNGSDPFSITFNPSATGVVETTVTIENDDPDENPFTFLIRGRGVAPEMTLLGNEFEIINGDDTPSVGDGTNFLDVLVDGGLETHKFIIKNDGDRNLIFLGASITPGTGFFLTDLPESNFPIPAKGSVPFNVNFNPSTDGRVTATIAIITTDTDETPYTFDVTANGVGDPALRLLNGRQNFEKKVEESQRIDFGQSELSEVNTERFVIENRGHGTLEYTVKVSNTQFRVANPGETLEPNQDHTFVIFFEPSSRGDKVAVVTISNNDPEQSPFSFIIEAEAIDPEMDLFGGEIFNMPISHLDTTPTSSDGTDFGTASVNEPGVTKTFRIFNSGEIDLIIAGHNLGNSSNFFLTELPTAIEPIAPNTGANFQITYEPRATGTHTFTVKITNSDDNENPYTFDIKGSGTLPSEFSSFSLSGTNGIFEVATVIGQQYTLTSSTTLEGPWTNVPEVTPVAGTGEIMTIEVDNLVTSEIPRQFFRMEITQLTK